MTPDLKSIVQSVISRSGWTPGNAISFIITGSGEREVSTFDTEDGGALAPKLIINYVPVAVSEFLVLASTDDAEELSLTEVSDFGVAGDLDLGSSDLELADDASFNGAGQTIGIRFGNIDIPKKAIIERAYIRFNQEDDNDGETIVQFKIEETDNALTFVNTPFNISSRSASADMVEWNIPAFTAESVNTPINTPDLTALVQSAVNRDGWQKGNAVAFIITGSGEREVSTFDTNPEGTKQAALIIEYLQSGPTLEVPELISQIPDVKTRAGLSFSYDLNQYFRDRDTKLFYSIAGVDGNKIPAGITVDDATGFLEGTSATPIYNLPIVVTAESFGEMVADTFNISFEPTKTRVLSQLGTLKLGAFDEGASEISTFDAMSKKLFVTNAESDRIDIVDMTNPAMMSLLGSIDITTYGGGINSVSAYNGLIVAAIEADVKQDNGKVVAFNTDGVFQWQVTVGALPDMVTFNEDGTKIIVANEGEPSGDYSVDPEGSISIIDVATQAVSTADFTAFNAQEVTLKAQGVRIFGRSAKGEGTAAGGTPATVAQDLEPEYITVEGNLAYVTLQENNALAIVDIAAATVTNVIALGAKDHSIAGNGIDASDKSDAIDIRTWPVFGYYMPDAITSFSVGTDTYLLTANEGDAREYESDSEELAFAEESRVKDLILDPTAFPNADFLQSNDALGRLTVTTINGDTDNDGDYDELYAYGARSFTIWNAATAEVVFDSGDELEQITAFAYPENFNTSNDKDSFKNRSDNKGPEPEAITVGTVGDITYAFVGLERMGGIAVYDITDPTSPQFVEYFNNRDFSIDVEAEGHGDLGPEGIVFIPAADSPNGTAMIVVSNEVSGTVTTYAIGEQVKPFTLSVFHNNDGESDVLPEEVTINGKETLAGGAGQFVATRNREKQKAMNEGRASIMLSSGDNFLAGTTYNASVQAGVFYDALLLDAIDYDAIDLGNHDFDFGTQILADFINTFETNKAPYLSANLDFTNVPELKALVDLGRILPSTKLEIEGEMIGIIGLTTPLLDVISSPGNTIINDNVVEIVQAQVTALENDGVNKIILISHLQGIASEKDLVSKIAGVDIVIAGGGDELLTNNPTLGQPFNLSVVDQYPVVSLDKNGDNVYLVTTPGNYRYLGNLNVDFDADGKITNVLPSDLIIVTGEADSTIVKAIEDPVRESIKDLAVTVLATSEVNIDFRREKIRGEESNGGNLFADALLWQAQETATDFGVKAPQIALQNSGGLRIENIIEAGPVTELNTFEVAAFTNILSVMEDITPTQLKAIMEWGVASAPSLDGRFPQIAGFEIVYDQTGISIAVADGAITTPGTKVLSIKLNDGTELVKNGMVVDGAPSVSLASIDFTLNGGDGYPFQVLGLTFKTIGATYQQAFRNYLVDADGLNGLVTAAQYPFEAAPMRIKTNTAPMIGEAIADQVINEGFTSTTIDLSETFTDTDVLSLSVVSDNMRW